jgi:hypothetical protein
VSTDLPALRAQLDQFHRRGPAEAPARVSWDRDPRS